jgi:hypothetical protein
MFDQSKLESFQGRSMHSKEFQNGSSIEALSWQPSWRNWNDKAHDEDARVFFPINPKAYSQTPSAD